METRRWFSFSKNICSGFIQLIKMWENRKKPEHMLIWDTVATKSGNASVFTIIFVTRNEPICIYKMVLFFNFLNKMFTYTSYGFVPKRCAALLTDHVTLSKKIIRKKTQMKRELTRVSSQSKQGITRGITTPRV